MALGFHLDLNVLLKGNVEHRRLYEWALVEVDGRGKQLGGDQIPWGWTLNFMAEEATLLDSLEVVAGKPHSELRQVIRAKLVPGHPRESTSPPTFSMFGTNRLITEFQLDIHPVGQSGREEVCEAWGCPSYSAEVDFRTDTTADCVCFYLFVRDDLFERYASLISWGLVTDLILSVNGVEGFYSEWSPGISTNAVKVLCADDEHQVSSNGELIAPPRLGAVHGASLHVSRRIGRDHLRGDWTTSP